MGTQLKEGLRIIKEIQRNASENVTELLVDIGSRGHVESIEEAKKLHKRLGGELLLKVNGLLDESAFEYVVKSNGSKVLIFQNNDNMTMLHNHDLTEDVVKGGSPIPDPPHQADIRPDVVIKQETNNDFSEETTASDLTNNNDNEVFGASSSWSKPEEQEPTPAAQADGTTFYALNSETQLTVKQSAVGRVPNFQMTTDHLAAFAAARAAAAAAAAPPPPKRARTISDRITDIGAVGHSGMTANQYGGGFPTLENREFDGSRQQGQMTRLQQVPTQPNVTYPACVVPAGVPYGCPAPEEDDQPNPYHGEVSRDSKFPLPYPSGIFTEQPYKLDSNAFLENTFFIDFKKRPFKEFIQGLWVPNCKVSGRSQYCVVYNAEELDKKLRLKQGFFIGVLCKRDFVDCTVPNQHYFKFIKAGSIYEIEVIRLLKDGAYVCGMNLEKELTGASQQRLLTLLFVKSTRLNRARKYADLLIESAIMDLTPFK